ncbi:MAG: hypothetical protein ACE15F_02905 [bacterium]
MIDGVATDAEWAGAEWTGDFYGGNFSINTMYLNEQIPREDLNWEWRALWGEEYLYFCMRGDFKYLTPNGWLYDGNTTTVLEADDTGYAGWGNPGCVDFEFFMEPNWKDGDGVNDSADMSPSYQICWFPLGDDVFNGEVVTPGNFGVRTGAEGPPFFFSGLNSTGAKFPATPWNPMTDPQEAATAGVKPFLIAAQPNPVAGAQEPDIVARPLLEVAIPYSQLGFVAMPDLVDYTIDDIPFEGINLIMQKDANGQWVKAGDEWLFNVCGYTDGYTMSIGLQLVEWNLMDGSAFNSAPRGILKFAAGAGVSDWMLQ